MKVTILGTFLYSFAKLSCLLCLFLVLVMSECQWEWSWNCILYIYFFGLFILCLFFGSKLVNMIREFVSNLNGPIWLVLLSVEMSQLHCHSSNSIYVYFWDEKGGKFSKIRRDPSSKLSNQFAYLFGLSLSSRSNVSGNMSNSKNNVSYLVWFRLISVCVINL